MRVQRAPPRRQPAAAGLSARAATQPPTAGCPLGRGGSRRDRAHRRHACACATHERLVAAFRRARPACGCDRARARTRPRGASAKGRPAAAAACRAGPPGTIARLDTVLPGSIRRPARLCDCTVSHGADRAPSLACGPARVPRYPGRPCRRLEPPRVPAARVRTGREGSGGASRGQPRVLMNAPLCLGGAGLPVREEQARALAGLSRAHEEHHAGTPAPVSPRACDAARGVHCVAAVTIAETRRGRGGDGDDGRVAGMGGGPAGIRVVARDGPGMRRCPPARGVGCATAVSARHGRPDHPAGTPGPSSPGRERLASNGLVSK